MSDKKMFTLLGLSEKPIILISLCISFMVVYKCGDESFRGSLRKSCFAEEISSGSTGSEREAGSGARQPALPLSSSPNAPLKTFQ